MVSRLTETTLLILGHGSSKHPDSSASVRRHTEILARKGCFADVRCAFLKEDPLIDDCLDGLEHREVMIVPDFLAEGYFTRKVIPAKLASQAAWKHCHMTPPVGSHPMMSELIQESAQALLDEWLMDETSLLVIGHGSGKNPCSKQTLLHHLGELRASASWGQVADLWLEEAPIVKDWQQVAKHRQVVVVPYLLNDGQHGGWDIPADLGIGADAQPQEHTHELGKHQVRLAPALGTSVRFADAIAEFARVWGGS